MALFVREYGPAVAPAVIFLHGGHLSGWSWQPVVDRMPQYRCLVPDLPQYGKSFELGPFDMSRAADAVAELIRFHVGTGHAHVVGYSLGAQVGLQLLATEPKLVDRAVLCGTLVNTLPGVRLAQRLLGTMARVPWFQQMVNRRWNAREVGVPAANLDDYHEDVRLSSGPQLAHVVVASAGFTIPERLDESDTPTLFLSGANERPFVRRWAATLAHRMPNGVDGAAAGMHHDWPLRCPDLFSRTASGWLSNTTLPPEIQLFS
ncbi:alpha/beta fold hydrolase [[Mycobacterium] fortunisiensis]|uniref:alpha/beta fold hydrolase n=1 Tax=[Mycobacterium] fortunisiensis TaxID=2600579 RepID=UPI001C262421|nr:alpha/beta fold hydrolase [[Mycobacterium] fortunisiensis]